jgi:hypothetical protein
MKKDKRFAPAELGKWLFLSLVGTGGCGSAPTDAAGEVDQGSSEVLVCSEREIGTDPRGYVTVDREVYVRSDLNRLLEQNSAFAAAAGISSVTDCESARQTMRAYVPYRDQHPDFDNESMGEEAFFPLEPTREFTTPRVDGAVPLPDLPVEKIFQGSEVSHVSIVRLDWVFPRPGQKPGLSTCTGSFIARQWIVTANHCVPPEARVIPTNAKDRRVPPGATATMFIYREFPTSVVRTIYTDWRQRR